MARSTSAASLTELLAGTEISTRGSSNHGCTVEIKLPGSDRGAESVVISDVLAVIRDGSRVEEVSQDTASAVARAVLVERERCAALAESLFIPEERRATPMPIEHPYKTVSDVALRLAAMIRVPSIEADSIPVGSATSGRSRPWQNPTPLVGFEPVWAGQFDTFDNWVSHASRALTGIVGEYGDEVQAVCVDALGRRCNVGGDFTRARDEGAFPVRYFVTGRVVLDAPPGSDVYRRASELLEVCAEDLGYGDEGGDHPDGDDEPVAFSVDNNSATCFGHLRRLRDALRAAAGLGPRAPT